MRAAISPDKPRNRGSRFAIAIAARNRRSRDVGCQDRLAQLPEDGLHHLTIGHCAAAAEVVGLWRGWLGCPGHRRRPVPGRRHGPAGAAPVLPRPEREEPEAANERRDERDIAVPAAAVHQRRTQQTSRRCPVRRSAREARPRPRRTPACDRCSARSAEARLEKRLVVPNATSLLTPSLGQIGKQREQRGQRCKTDRGVEAAGVRRAMPPMPAAE